VISAEMGSLSSQFGGSPDALASPVRFDNAVIDTVSHVRLASHMRLLRRMKRLIAVSFR
jgi:hypothetical protein